MERCCRTIGRFSEAWLTLVVPSDALGCQWRFDWWRCLDNAGDSVMTTDAWKVAMLVAATALFMSSVWGAIAYFKVPDASARTGKQAVSLFGGFAMLVSLWNVYRIEHVEPTQASAALCLLGGGAWLFWQTVYTCHRREMAFAFSSTVPVDLIVNGPYRAVRHPFYLSYLLGWAGCAVAAPNGLSLAILATMFLIYRAAAGREEDVLLTSSWGPAYRSYLAVTGRFVPRLRRISRAAGDWRVGQGDDSAAKR
jgi:protein-S-isoprenylcysteine O-methyltransferase Ste14